MSEPSEDDLREMRDMMMGVIAFPPTDDELRVAWTNPRLVSLAREWGWGDTELREELAAELEQNRSAGARTAAPSSSTDPEFRLTRQQQLLDPAVVRLPEIRLDETALRLSEQREQRVTATSGDVGMAARPEIKGDAMNQTDSDAGAPGASAPGSPVTLLLIVLLAVTGGAAIVLLTFAQPLWAGLACTAVAAAVLWITDRRLRRRAEVRSR